MTSSTVQCDIVAVNSRSHGTARHGTLQNSRMLCPARVVARCANGSAAMSMPAGMTSVPARIKLQPSHCSTSCVNTNVLVLNVTNMILNPHNNVIWCSVCDRDSRTVTRARARARVKSLTRAHARVDSRASASRLAWKGRRYTVTRARARVDRARVTRGRVASQNMSQESA